MSTMRAEWRTLEQARRNWQQQCAPFVATMLKSGQPVAAVFMPLDEAKSDQQRKFLHGVVLLEISQQARIGTAVYTPKVWKEYFRDKYLGSKRVTYTNPVTGNQVVREEPVSTESLGVRAYSQFIEQVMAEAATDFGVRFTCQDWQSYGDLQ